MKKIFFLSLLVNICAINLSYAWEMNGAYVISETREASTPINFEVTIEKKNCVISAGFQPTINNPTVHLGTVSRAPGSKGAAVPVFFSFEKCDGVDKLLSIEFVRDLESGKNDGIMGGGKDFISTTNKDVKVYLWKDPAGTQKFTKLEHPNGTPIRFGERITVCYAQAQVSDRGANKYAEFEGSGEFKVTYQ